MFFSLGPLLNQSRKPSSVLAAAYTLIFRPSFVVTMQRSPLSLPSGSDTFLR